LIPVTVITGFLGSGKTTLLNALLQHPALADTAVIINEFGEIAIDHMLVSSPAENMVLLDTGCLCCTVRGDLVQTLATLHEKRKSGAIPVFARVLIETTGLADPVPLLQTIVADPALNDLTRSTVSWRPSTRCTVSISSTGTPRASNRPRSPTHC